MRISPVQNQFFDTSLSRSQLEIDAQCFGFGQAIQAREIAAFQGGGLSYSLVRCAGGTFVSHIFRRVLSLVAVATEAMVIESLRRFRVEDSNASPFWQSWRQSFVQMSLLRGLSAYLPSQSVLFRHLTVDAACLLSEELFQTSSSTHPVARRLFEIEAQNWQWALASQVFRRLGGWRLQTLEQRLQRISPTAPSRSRVAISSFATESLPREPGHMRTFEHPDSVERYLHQEGIDPKRADVCFEDGHGNTFSAVWAQFHKTFRQMHARSKGVFQVRVVESHPVPEFAHLCPRRLVEDILPVLESSRILVNRFPHGILRHSLDYLAEHSPQDLYFLRRKCSEFGLPITAAAERSLSDWLHQKLASMPQGERPCTWILRELRNYEPDPSALAVLHENELPTGAWRFNERHFSVSDLQRRQAELLNRRPTEVEAFERHLESLEHWVHFLTTRNEGLGYSADLRTHLRVLLQSPHFGSLSSFRLAASTFLRLQRRELPKLEFTALIPFVMHPQFRAIHYPVIFETIRAHSRSEAAYVESLFRHGLYLYDLTRDFSLKEAFENEIRRSTARNASSLAIEFAQQVQSILKL